MTTNSPNEEHIKCPNCGHSDTGQFCSACGLSLTQNRLSLSILASSIIDFFYNIEDKYRHTFVALLLRPIGFVNEYLSGKRAQYYIPFKYFFFNLSINFFVYSYFNLGQINDEKLDLEIEQLAELKSEVMFDKIIDNYGNFFSLAIIPVYVIVANVLFGNKKHNSGEKATAITFLLGQLIVFEILLSFISAAYNPFYTIQKYLVMLAEISIVFVLSYQFFQQTLLNTLWKSLIIITTIYFSMNLLVLGLMKFLQLIYNE